MNKNSILEKKNSHNNNDISNNGNDNDVKNERLHGNTTRF